MMKKYEIESMNCSLHIHSNKDFIKLLRYNVNNGGDFDLRYYTRLSYEQLEDLMAYTVCQIHFYLKNDVAEKHFYNGIIDLLEENYIVNKDYE